MKNLSLGINLLNEGRPFEALDKINQVSPSEYPEANYIRAIALSRLGDTQEALAAIQKFCSTNPNHTQGLSLLNAIQTASTITAEKHKPKLMQLVSFYDVYTHQLYSRYPELASASLSDQFSKILSEGFAAVHMFAPTLATQGYETRLVIFDCDPLLAKWAHDHGITAIEGSDPRRAIVRQQVEEFNPDVLLISHPVGGYDSTFVRTLTTRPKLVMGWRAAAIPPETDWSEFDIMLSHLSWSREEALKRGAKKAIHFHPGVPRVVPDFAIGIEKKYDIVITGQWTPEHGTRNMFIASIVDAIESGEIKATLGLFLNAAGSSIPQNIAKYNQGPLWAADMHRAIASGRIVVNGEIDLARGEAGNMRLFEVTGTGSFLLTQHHKNIEKYFIPGKEIETFSNEIDLVEKIKQHLADPQRREEIAIAGQKRCLEDYSMEKQCQKLNQIIQSFMNPEEDVTPDTQDTLLKGINALEGKRFPEALTIFESILAKEPNSPDALQGKAIALGELGRIEEAVPVLRKQIELDPNNKDAARLLAALEKHIGVSAKKEPQVPQNEALLKQAMELTVKGEFLAALDCCIEAKKNRAMLQDLDYVRAICFLKLNKIGEAREALKEELRYYPNNSRAVDLYEMVKKVEGSNDTQILQFHDQEFFELYKSISNYTMAPPVRLYQLFCHAKEVCLRDIPGNFVECGVAAGGSSALISAVIKRYSKRKRIHFAFDSFEGMPTPTENDRDSAENRAADATGWGTGTCAAPEASLLEVCRKVGSDDIVIPVKGYFENTLPVWREKIGPIAMLHLDGDWYESTKAILINLYSQVVPGGVLQVDDYGHWVGCKKALHEFEGSINQRFNLNSIDGSGVWFTKA